MHSFMGDTLRVLLLSVIVCVPLACGTDDFVRAHQTDFVVGDKPFRFAGTNCYYVTYKSRPVVDDVLVGKSVFFPLLLSPHTQHTSSLSG